LYLQLGVGGGDHGEGYGEGDALTQGAAGWLPFCYGHVTDLARGEEGVVFLVEIFNELSYALDKGPTLDDGLAVVRTELLLQAVVQLLVPVSIASLAAHDPCSSGTWVHLHLQTECEAGVKVGGYGRMIRIPLEKDRRIFTPICRSTAKWKRAYDRRTAVERVNSRIDQVLGFDRHTIRGKVKMQMRMGLALVVMLAMALGRIRLGQRDKMRSLTEPVERAD